MCGACVGEDGGEGGDCAGAIVDSQGLRNWARRFGVAGENGVEPSGFIEDCARIAIKEFGEIGFVGPLAWRTRAENLVEIFLQLSLDLRVAGEEDDGVGERVSAGFEAG